MWSLKKKSRKLYKVKIRKFWCALLQIKEKSSNFKHNYFKKNHKPATQWYCSHKKSVCACSALAACVSEEYSSKPHRFYVVIFVYHTELLHGFVLDLIYRIQLLPVHISFANMIKKPTAVTTVCLFILPNFWLYNWHCEVSLLFFLHKDYVFKLHSTLCFMLHISHLNYTCCFGVSSICHDVYS